MSEARCAPSASNASSRTSRALTYSGSGAPGIRMLPHPSDQLLALRGATAWTAEEIRRDLGERREGSAFLGPGTSIDDGIERAKEHDVRAGVCKTKPQGLGRGRGVLDIRHRHPW